MKFQARHTLFQQELSQCRLIGYVLKPESLEAPIDIGQIDFVAFLHLLRNGEMVAKDIQQKHFQAWRDGPHTEHRKIVLLFGLGSDIRGHVKRALRYGDSANTVRGMKQVAFRLVVNGEETLVLLLEDVATWWDWFLPKLCRVVNRPKYVLELVVLLFVEQVLTQELALFGTWILPDGSDAFTRGRVLFRQVEMLPPTKI